MALQNRVDPFGVLFADAARGLYTGNRGIIHDPDTKTLLGNRWTTKAWICCSLDYQGRRRDVWGRNGPEGAAGWTELFFADEVTALAAGHRPCFFCRRADAEAFQAAFAQGSGLEAMPAPEMDAILHGERRLSMAGEPQRLSPIDLPGLPDGTMVEAGGTAYALRERRALAWRPDGYGSPAALSDLMRAPVTLITPRATVSALRNGYRPAWRGDSAA